MLPWESRRLRRSGRARRRPDLTAVESLEQRALLAYTALGTSLPDLTVSGFTSPVTSWGHNLTVTVDVNNIGASTMIEPLALQPGSTSTADAGPSVVGVFVTTRPRFNPATADLIGTVNAPAIPQNSSVQVTQTISMPQQPRGFPGDGGRVYVWFVANLTSNVNELDTTNNLSNPSRVSIEAPLPELVPVAIDLPSTMQPGDTIQPTIEIQNLGPVDTSSQGPVTVDLVASVTPTFGPGSSIVAQYTVDNIPGADSVASMSPVIGNTNLNPQQNIVTIHGTPVTLPTSPTRYFLGVVVDPTGSIKQIQGIGSFRNRHNPFGLATRVGPSTSGLPPAGVVSGVIIPNPPFPFPITGVPVGTPNTNITGTTTSSSVSPQGFPTFVTLANPEGNTFQVPMLHISQIRRSSQH